MAEKEKFNSRYLYIKLKDIYENATMTNITNEVILFKRISLGYFASLLVFAGLGLYFSAYLGTNPVALVGSILVFGIYMYLLVQWADNALIKHFGENSSKRIKEKRKFWQGTRYWQFRKNAQELLPLDALSENFSQFDNLLDKEIVISSNPIWNHKLSASWIALILLGVGGIVRMLSGGTPEQKALLVVGTLILIVCYPLLYTKLEAIQTEEKKIAEFKQFLRWLEYDLEEEKNKISII